MSDNVRTSGPRGFTLMEILAALLLIGLILPAAMKGISMASILASDSARKYEAMDLAETKLAEILLQETWKNGSATGTFEEEYEQYQWGMDVSDWTTAGLKEIDVIVSWQQRGRRRQLALSTLVYAKE